MSTLYTQADYDALKTAYMSLLKGEKVVQASVQGEFIRYQDIQIKQCKALLSEMAVELGLVPTRAYAQPKGRLD
jgi:hypothetical protein